MGLALFFILLLFVTIGIGIFGIIVSIDLFEYLKRFHTEKYKEMSFERPFGMAREDFFFHAVKPIEFIRFIFSPQNFDDVQVLAYTKKLKLVTLSFLALLIILILFSVF